MAIYNVPKETSGEFAVGVGGRCPRPQAVSEAYRILNIFTEMESMHPKAFPLCTKQDLNNVTPVKHLNSNIKR